MADLSSLLPAIASGLLSGGGSAATTFMGFFRDMRGRIKALEEKLGSNEDPKTGLHFVVERLDDTVKKLKREVEGWADDPPPWMIRLVSRAARGSVNSEHHQEMEQLIEQRFRTNANNIRRLEESLDSLEKSLKNFVEQSDYERDARTRAEELAKVREQLATSNGLLRGVMSALGYIDPEHRQRGK